ncbi:MAG: hypothetical protein P8Z68_02890, partial [Kineosporiaceae bacterium]
MSDASSGDPHPAPEGSGGTPPDGSGSEATGTPNPVPGHAPAPGTLPTADPAEESSKPGYRTVAFDADLFRQAAAAAGMPPGTMPGPEPEAGPGSTPAGPEQAGPVQAGPVQAGPTSVGPVQAGPVQAGP